MAGAQGGPDRQTKARLGLLLVLVLVFVGQLPPSPSSCLSNQPFVNVPLLLLLLLLLLLPAPVVCSYLRVPYMVTPRPFLLLHSTSSPLRPPWLSRCAAPSTSSAAIE
jgi:hypothetical protein